MDRGEWENSDHELDTAFSSELRYSAAHDSASYGCGLLPAQAWFPELESALRAALRSVGKQCGVRPGTPDSATTTTTDTTVTTTATTTNSSGGDGGVGSSSDARFVSFAVLGPTGGHLLVESLAALCDALAMSGGDELLYGGFRCGPIIGLLTRVLRGAATMASDVQAARHALAAACQNGSGAGTGDSDEAFAMSLQAQESLGTQMIELELAGEASIRAARAISFCSDALPAHALAAAAGAESCLALVSVLRAVIGTPPPVAITAVNKCDAFLGAHNDDGDLSLASGVGMHAFIEQLLLSLEKLVVPPSAADAIEADMEVEDMGVEGSCLVEAQASAETGSWAEPIKSTHEPLRVHDKAARVSPLAAPACARVRLSFLTYGGIHTVLSLLHVSEDHPAAAPAIRLNTATQRVAARVVAAACLAIVPTTSALAAATVATHAQAEAQAAAQGPAMAAAGGKSATDEKDARKEVGGIEERGQAQPTLMAMPARIPQHSETEQRTRARCCWPCRRNSKQPKNTKVHPCADISGPTASQPAMTRPQTTTKYAARRGVADDVTDPMAASPAALLRGALRHVARDQHRLVLLLQHCDCQVALSAVHAVARLVEGSATAHCFAHDTDTDIYAGEHADAKIDVQWESDLCQCLVKTMLACAHMCLVGKADNEIRSSPNDCATASRADRSHQDAAVSALEVTARATASLRRLLPQQHPDVTDPHTQGAKTTSNATVTAIALTTARRLLHAHPALISGLATLPPPSATARMRCGVLALRTVVLLVRHSCVCANALRTHSSSACDSSNESGADDGTSCDMGTVALLSALVQSTAAAAWRGRARQYDSEIGFTASVAETDSDIDTTSSPLRSMLTAIAPSTTAAAFVEVLKLFDALLQPSAQPSEALRSRAGESGSDMLCSALLWNGTAGALLMAAFGPSCLCLPSNNEEPSRAFDCESEEECREWCRQIKLQNAMVLNDECSTADEHELRAPVLAALSLLLQPLSCTSSVIALLSEGNTRLSSGRSFNAAMEIHLPHVGAGPCRMAALARVIVVALRQAASDASALGDNIRCLHIHVYHSARAAITIARRLLHLSTSAQPYFACRWRIALLREGAEPELAVLCELRRRQSRASRDANIAALARAARELVLDCKRVAMPDSKKSPSREEVVGNAVQSLGQILDEELSRDTSKSDAQDESIDDRARKLLASLQHLRWALFGGRNANGCVLVGLVSTHEMLHTGVSAILNRVLEPDPERSHSTIRARRWWVMRVQCFMRVFVAQAPSRMDQGQEPKSSSTVYPVPSPCPFSALVRMLVQAMQRADYGTPMLPAVLSADAHNSMYQSTTQGHSSPRIPLERVRQQNQQQQRQRWWRKLGSQKAATGERYLQSMSMTRKSTQRKHRRQRRSFTGDIEAEHDDVSWRSGGHSQADHQNRSATSNEGTNQARSVRDGHGANDGDTSALIRADCDVLAANRPLRVIFIEDASIVAGTTSDDEHSHFMGIAGASRESCSKIFASIDPHCKMITVEKYVSARLARIQMQKQKRMLRSSRRQRQQQQRQQQHGQTGVTSKGKDLVKETSGVNSAANKNANGSDKEKNIGKRKKIETDAETKTGAAGAGGNDESDAGQPMITAQEHRGTGQECGLLPQDARAGLVLDPETHVITESELDVCVGVETDVRSNGKLESGQQTLVMKVVAPLLLAARQTAAPSTGFTGGGAGTSVGKSEQRPLVTCTMTTQQDRCSSAGSASSTTFVQSLFGALLAISRQQNDSGDDASHIQASWAAIRDSDVIMVLVSFNDDDTGACNRVNMESRSTSVENRFAMSRRHIMGRMAHQSNNGQFNPHLSAHTTPVSIEGALAAALGPALAAMLRLLRHAHTMNACLRDGRAQSECLDNDNTKMDSTKSRWHWSTVFIAAWATEVGTVAQYSPLPDASFYCHSLGQSAALVLNNPIAASLSVYPAWVTDLVSNYSFILAAPLRAAAVLVVARPLGDALRSYQVICTGADSNEAGHGHRFVDGQHDSLTSNSRLANQWVRIGTASPRAVRAALGLRLGLCLSPAEVGSGDISTRVGNSNVNGALSDFGGALHCITRLLSAVRILSTAQKTCMAAETSIQRQGGPEWERLTVQLRALRDAQQQGASLADEMLDHASGWSGRDADSAGLLAVSRALSLMLPSPQQLPVTILGAHVEPLDLGVEGTGRDPDQTAGRDPDQTAQFGSLRRIRIRLPRPPVDAGLIAGAEPGAGAGVQKWSGLSFLTSACHALGLNPGRLTPDSSLRCENGTEMREQEHNDCVLELSFEGEEGFGLGPTLEGFSSLCAVLCDERSGVWCRANDSSTNDSGACDLLFPRPQCRPHEAIAGQIAPSVVFELLGKVTAHALADGRNSTGAFDLPLHPMFLHQLRRAACKSSTASRGGASITGANAKLCDVMDHAAAVSDTVTAIIEGTHGGAERMTRVEDVNDALDQLASVDRQLSRSLHTIWTSLGAGEDEAQDTVLDDLGIDFTLPGDADYELCAGGSELLLCRANAAQYVRLVLEARLGDGILYAVQAFVRGFSAVLPAAMLAAFTVAELHAALAPSRLDDVANCCSSDWPRWPPDASGEQECGSAGGDGSITGSDHEDDAHGEEAGTRAVLSCLRADHGFTSTSPQLHWLANFMLRMSPEQRRCLLQFATGCRTLPRGGLRQVGLTVVRRRCEVTSSTDTEAKAVIECAADAHLPSVSTCHRVLHVPEYSSQKVLEARFLYACRCGAGFELS